MIDIKDLRENPDRYRQAAEHKRITVDIDTLLDLDTRHRELLTTQQELTAKKNQIGKQIGDLAGQLRNATPDRKAELEKQMHQLQQRPAELKRQEQNIQERINQLHPQLEEALLLIPQPADDEAPVGTDDTQNTELRRWGTVREFDFEPKDHIALGRDLGIIDIERGVKLAGTRSYVLTGAGCTLHQAVLRLAMDMMIERGFTPMTVPMIVREPAMQGTGYFPAGREQTYAMPDEDPALFLVGTSEVPLTAYHMGEVLDGDTLPRRYAAMSACFRREAGTYGKDTAGLYRIHQFEKVEQVIIAANDTEQSKAYHHEILENSEAVLQALNIPYRVVAVCTGDLGQGQAAKYDIEAWMPSRDAWGETHSASRFYEFQARRLNLRYRDAGGKVRFCHTLNNTVIASPRILIPLLELNQNSDGSVAIPEILRPYMGGCESLASV